MQPRAHVGDQATHLGLGTVVGQFDADRRTHDLLDVAHEVRPYALARSNAACSDSWYDWLV